MKWLFYTITFIFFSTSLNAQNISGKWYGKAFQGPGELCTTCEFELNLSQAKNIRGESYTYIKDTTDIRIGLSGYFDGDTIRLEEDKALIYSNITPPDWNICIKKIMIKYQLVGNVEFLIGRGTGRSIEDDSPCIPAKFVFSRNLEELNKYAATYNDSLNFVINPEPPVPVFTPVFLNTSVNKINEIEVTHRNLQIRLSDYLNVDDDTVSIYLNRIPLAKNVWISKRPVRINFHLDARTSLHEILLYAENLGKIPPNTSLMEIIDGSKSYRIRIESDKQKTAAIYLRYKP